jgi:Flp pilus assembly protein TadG
LQRHRTKLRRNSEQGIIITLIAVFVLFVLGAMAALSIDVVTFYTARSEAQLAADGAALAGARVLANSGMTSDPNAASDNFVANAEPLAQTIATQVGASNNVGGRLLKTTEVTVTFNDTASSFVNNPQVTVQVQRTDIPTFFARIWGKTQVTVGASATAEAYNPSGTAGGPFAVAPICVKPWLLPNIDPSNPGNPVNPNPIFSVSTGALQPTTANLLGWRPIGNGPTAYKLSARCTTNCGPTPPAPTTVWKYYPGDPADFPPPLASSVTCTSCAGFNNYQLSIAGCVQTPISCSGIAHVYTANTDPNLDSEAAAAVDALTNSTTNEGDKVDTLVQSPPNGTEPFQFLAGGDNPAVIPGAMAAQTNIMVSDSLVTVPVIDTTPATWPPANYPQVQIIGFVQLFLNPNGGRVPPSNYIRTRVINLVGCGTPAQGGASSQPWVNGNGASPVTVRLITPSS